MWGTPDTAIRLQGDSGLESGGFPTGKVGACKQPVLEALERNNFTQFQGGGPALGPQKVPGCWRSDWTWGALDPGGLQLSAGCL